MSVSEIRNVHRIWILGELTRRSTSTRGDLLLWVTLSGSHLEGLRCMSLIFLTAGCLVGLFS